MFQVHAHDHTNKSHVNKQTKMVPHADNPSQMIRVKFMPFEWEYNTAVCASAMRFYCHHMRCHSVILMREICVCGKPRANSDGSSLPHYTKNIPANSQQDNNATADIFPYFQL